MGKEDIWKLIAGKPVHNTTNDNGRTMDKLAIKKSNIKPIIKSLHLDKIEETKRGKK